MTSKHAWCLVILASAAAAAEPEFPYEKARAATVFTAVSTAFPDGSTGFTTCGAVIVDAKKKLLLVPLQCLGSGKELACKSALEAPADQQQVPNDFRKWLAEGHTCEVVRKFPELNLALLKSKVALPSAAAAAPMREAALKVGERAWSVGFPEQIPALLTQGTVAVVLNKVRIDRMPPEFKGTLIGVSGAISEGSAGAGLYDAAGALAGIIIADAKYFDGGFAVPASTLAKLDLR